VPRRLLLGRLLPVAVAAFLLVAGCGADAPPQVTFAAGQATVAAGPTQFCTAAFDDCRNDPAAPVELAVPAGTAVRISVPDEVATTPWAVVFSYRTAAGEPVDGRSPLIAADQRSEYTLDQVQQFTAPPQANPETGEIDFPASSTWVLTASA
jgi:hypothetical protein